MPIEFQCTQCGKQLRTPDETAGKQAKCPQCGAVTPIPHAAAFAPLPSFTPNAPSHAVGYTPLPSGPAQDQDTFEFNPYASPTTTPVGSRGYAARIDRRQFASRGKRFIGMWVDNLIYVAAVAPGFIMLSMAGDDAPRGRGNGGDADYLAILGLLVFLGGLLAVAIANCIMISQSGQSLAKKLLGMKIVKADGEPPGFVSGVLLRAFLPGVLGAFFGGLFAFADAVAIFGEDRRCIHDHFAGTYVVEI
jgi:uncharacterized RDD family membrane protein YckC